MQNRTDCTQDLPCFVDTFHVCALFRDMDVLGGMVAYASPRAVHMDRATELLFVVTGDVLLESTDTGFFRFRGDLEKLMVRENMRETATMNLWSLTIPFVCVIAELVWSYSWHRDLVKRCEYFAKSRATVHAQQ